MAYSGEFENPKSTVRSIRREAARAFRFEGMKELQNALADIVDATSGREAKDVFYEAGVVLATQIRANAPRGRTGNLRSAIYVARGPDIYPNVLVGFRWPRGAHAHLVEYGHGGPHPAPPHPFVRPAISSTKGQIQQIIRDGLGNIIARHATRRAA